jgi:hypothetical protein
VGRHHGLLGRRSEDAVLGYGAALAGRVLLGARG